MWYGVQGGAGHLKFFRFELGGGNRLRQEIFYLAYHLHWPWSEVMSLGIGERKVYVRMLASRIEEENHAVDAMAERIRRG
jgi:hypothetical protein